MLQPLYLDNFLECRQHDVVPDEAYRAGKHESAPLGHKRAYGHTGYVVIEAVDEHQAHRDVAQVDEYRYPHGCAGVLHAEKPTRHNVGAEYGGSAPYENFKVGACEYGGVGLDIHEP